jgi:hypothetical protein
LRSRGQVRRVWEELPQARCSRLLSKAFCRLIRYRAFISYFHYVVVFLALVRLEMPHRRQSDGPALIDREAQEAEVIRVEVGVLPSATRAWRRSSSNAGGVLTKKPEPAGARAPVHIHVSAGDSNGWPDLVVAERPPQEPETRKRRWLQVRRCVCN